MPVELVGRAMAEDAIAFHTHAEHTTIKEFVADNNTIRRLAQPKVVCYTTVSSVHMSHTHACTHTYAHTHAHTLQVSSSASPQATEQTQNED